MAYKFHQDQALFNKIVTKQKQLLSNEKAHAIYKIWKYGSNREFVENNSENQENSRWKTTDSGVLNTKSGAEFYSNLVKVAVFEKGNRGNCLKRLSPTETTGSSL